MKKSSNKFSRFIAKFIAKFITFNDIGLKFKNVATIAAMIMAIIGLTNIALLYILATFVTPVALCFIPPFFPGILLFPITLVLGAVVYAVIGALLTILCLVCIWITFAPMYALGELVDAATQTKKNTDLLVKQSQTAE